MYTFFSYEYKIKEYIRDAISEYDVFIDVGACIGDYSIWLAKNQLRCISFEPNKDNYTCLVDNIKLNYLEKSIKTYNHGLGRKSEKVLFEIHPLNKGYSGKYSTFEDGEKQEVDIKVFDRIFKNLDVHHHQAFIMKIDAEGMESEIIAGAKEFLSGAKKVLLIFEAHTHMKKIEAELSKITEIQLTPLDELNVAVTIDNTNKPTTLRTANTCDNYGNKPKDL